jgi:hypothetical protein
MDEGSLKMPYFNTVLFIINQKNYTLILLVVNLKLSKCEVKHE